ncbi:sensor histidine kinase [Cognatiluteimonas profundi]|uniref:sensor histidine kinase n=1 Tax=Cognatiluteimonas profundi TaxID=2594501 RepID=UPI00131E16B6|nr:sensor histidine kinase [Lysobacter profundi]
MEPTQAVAHRQPSLRRRLLAFLLIPTLALMLLDTAFVYYVALRYSNGIHDRDLAFSTLGLAQALQEGRSGGGLTREAHLLLEYNPNGQSFFSVRSQRHGVVSSSKARIPPLREAPTGSPPILFDASIDAMPVRVASVTIPSPVEPGDRLVVSLAESLHGRHQRAKEILWLTIPIESALIVVLLALVWQGVKFGLQILDPPIRRLAARERNLEPISGPDIPIEILPLTRTIDVLFGRVQALVALQDRFIADAAHQLRTPLAGLAMHVERASKAHSESDFVAAMQHVQALTARVTRSATQLLALARAQGRQDDASTPQYLDLAAHLPEIVASRIPESLHAGVDLGYDAGDQPAMIRGDSNALQELFDNLIDNALNHVSRGGVITISLRVPSESGGGILAAVDDDGPGVPDDLIPRLGERFFRSPGAPGGGSGLGLAIVRRIAEAHGAKVSFGRSILGGLRVELLFPPPGTVPA